MNRYQPLIYKIDKLCEERAKEYPHRGEAFKELQEASNILSNLIIDDIDLDDFSPKKSIITNISEFANNPIFICGPGKSGTTLLTQLLDGHPELFVMPGDSNFINNLEKWHRGQWEEIANYWIKRIINPTGEEPFWFLGKDPEAFKYFVLHLNYLLSHTEMMIFQSVVMSLYATNSINSKLIRKKYWVEKTPQNELNTSKIKKILPKAKFIHIIRDPIQNIISLNKQAQLRSWKSTTIDYAFRVKKLFDKAKKNVVDFKEGNYLIISYEDLVKNTKSSMETISAFLDIKFHSSLLKPTQNNVPAKANSMFKSDRVIGEINTKALGRDPHKYLSKSELIQIVSILYHQASFFGYDWVEFKKYKYPIIFFKMYKYPKKFFNIIKSFILKNIFLDS